MLLVSAKIGPFKSIEKPKEVKIENDVTVLVGMNETGKTVFYMWLGGNLGGNWRDTTASDNRETPLAGTVL